MEAQEDQASSPPSDHHHRQGRNIIKGKRTKRQRQSSPLVPMTSTSSTASAGGGVGVDHDYLSSPTTSSTEEEEDMANCLIMLAQGHLLPAHHQHHHDHDRLQLQEITSHKVSTSQKFNEVSTTNKATAAASGFIVYECKTCNRSFPSFQALGGHRASHKKPKPNFPSKDNRHVHDPEEARPRLNMMIINSSPPQAQTTFSLQPNSSNTNIHKLCHSSNKSKIHECSICGSEFTSGQALGGHMRRHRAAAVAVGAAGGSNIIQSVETSSTNDSNNGDTVNEMKPRNILALDLNLPAPEDHDLKYSGLVFSTPALVDCHY